MHSHTQAHDSRSGIGWSAANAVLAILLTLLFLIFLFLFLTPTAQPLQAQNSVPATAREAAAMPQFAARLAHRATTQPRSPARDHAAACSARGYSDQKASPLDAIYANGPVDGICDIQHCTVDAWTVNFGFQISNTVGASGSIGGLTFALWMFPGDTLLSVDWLAGTQPFGSDLGRGTANVASDQYLFTNQYGYDIHKIIVNGLNATITPGNWVTLQNAVVTNGDPAFWDENAGPSLAQESSIGTIPSESFNTTGANGCMPEHSGNFKVIHDFSGGEDGARPSGVVIDSAGNLYGPTQPYNAAGSVYKMVQAGSSWVIGALYNFLGGESGSSPSGVIVGTNGVLYGAAGGGIQDCSSGQPCGLVFGVRPAPTVCRTASCFWTENVLYRFTGSTDAWSGSGLVTDRSGNLYGVSYSGGAQQQGAVFELSPSIGGWTESILYSFNRGDDGGGPTTVLVGNDGNLYGMASFGGAYGGGVVFRLSPSANSWTETVLYNIPPNEYFGNTYPHSLVQDSAGNLFGEYDYTPCCANLYGVVFMLSPSNGQWVYTELRHGDEQRYFGEDVFVNLIVDAAGNLYGTGAGSSGCIELNAHGYIFKLTRVNGGWQYSTPVSWDEYTSFPTGGSLALDAHGNLYGTTNSCGSHDQGTVWELTP